MSSFTIFNMEMLEKITAFQTFLRDENKNLRGWNVLLARIVFVSLVIFISIFLTDLRIVYAINGVFLNSFIGLIIPGMLGITRSSGFRCKDSLFIKVSDWICVVAGAFAFLIYFYDLFQG